MRNGMWRGVASAIVLLLVVGVVAMFAYHFGETRGIAAAAGGGAGFVGPGHPGPEYMGRGYGMHGGGFFFFPFLLFPIGLFLFFGLLRMAFFGFGGRRHWMHHGMCGDDQPMRARMEEWHREAHRTDASVSAPAAPPAAPPTEQ